VTIIQFTDAGKNRLRSSAQVHKTDASGTATDPAAIEVTRQQGTERAFTGQYYDLHDKDSTAASAATTHSSVPTRIRLGTGWPSFWAPIAKENIRTRPTPAWDDAR